METRHAIKQDSASAEPPEPPHQIFLANEQQTLAIDASRLTAAVRSVLEDSPYEQATVSVALVDDPTIHALNRRYLEHDYPTDVLSFVLEDDGRRLHGELVASADTAARNAVEYGWSAEDELLLYLVHGALHLVGHRDAEPAEIAAMRRAEAVQLAKLGVALPADHMTLVEEGRR
jgi:probable rRNA maturation factor